MGLDEALMAAAREGRVTLRFYRWAPPCLSFGRNQAARDRYDEEAARAEGIEIVRRPTGGRTVFHHREITYAVTAPATLWGGLRRSYGRINRALRRGLGDLGIRAAEAGLPPGRGSRTPGPGARSCFRDPVPGEIVASGRKLIGSAQWRHRGALLQHGSILLHDEQAVAERLRRGAPAGRRASRAVSLSDLLPGLPPLPRIVSALRAGFRREFGIPVQPAVLGEEERESARRLARRYESPDWTWRR